MKQSGVATILSRELLAYFNSPIAYIFVIVFALLTGNLFMTQFFMVGSADMRIFFHFLPLILCVFLPAISMRLWAEEKRGNTFELLLTFPIPPHALVVGKFLASLVFYLFSLAATLPIPIMLFILGKPDLGPIFGGYAGAVLVGAFFLALGIFISGFSKDQIVAFVIGMLTCFSIFLIGTELIASSIDGWVPGLGSFLRNYIGLSSHFSSFQKGVLDFRDILYFVIGISLFLALNGFWIEGRMRPNQKTIFSAAAAIAALIFLFSNWFLADINLGRVDLTQGKIYTVSSVSKRILQNLKAPVTLKFYISSPEKMPTGMKTLEQEVIDKLDEFKVAANGKFDYKVFHMEAANTSGGETQEEALAQKGIEPFQVQSIEADEVGLKLVYSAISIAYKEKPEDTIPRIMPMNLPELEYMIFSKIYRLTLDKRPSIALVAPYEEQSIDPNLIAVFAQLGKELPPTQTLDEYKLAYAALDYEGYEVHRIRLDEKEPIPEHTDTLVILEPKELTENQRFAINRFLIEGGSVFLAVQNYKFEYAPAEAGEVDIKPTVLNPGINSLLAEWGLEVDERFLLDENSEVLNIAGAARVGPFDLSVPLKLPLHIRIDQDQMNPDLSVTAQLPPILYLWGSALKINAEKTKSLNLHITKLLNSSTEAWMMPAGAPMLSLASFSEHPAIGKEIFPLALLVEGQFPNAFQETQSKEPVKLAPGKLILIGASTPFQEQLIKGGGHFNFLLNAIDTITLKEDLAQIRSKQPVDRTMGHISTPAKMGWRLFASLLIPVVVSLLGGFRIFMRRQTKQNYLRSLLLQPVS